MELLGPWKQSQLQFPIGSKQALLWAQKVAVPNNGFKEIILFEHDSDVRSNDAEKWKVETTAQARRTSALMRDMYERCTIRGQIPIDVSTPNGRTIIGFSFSRICECF